MNQHQIIALILLALLTIAACGVLWKLIAWDIVRRDFKFWLRNVSGESQRIHATLSDQRDYYQAYASRVQDAFEEADRAYAEGSIRDRQAARQKLKRAVYSVITSHRITAGAITAERLIVRNVDRETPRVTVKADSKRQHEEARG